jgi:iron complex transport system substrate-binding protein
MRLLLLPLLLVSGLAHAADAYLMLRDDSKTDVRLSAPAKRIVSLAPNITEVVYAAGAGDKLVGTVDFSDYPVAAKKLLRV